MATQLVTIAKISGVAAYAVAELFRRWDESRLVRDEYEEDPTHWPQKTKDELEKFERQLIDQAKEFPVVYCSQYIDSYSAADTFSYWYPKKKKDHLYSILDTCCYVLPDDGCLRRYLKKLLNPGWFQEKPFYLDARLYVRLLEAEEEYDFGTEKSVIILIRDAYSASRDYPIDWYRSGSHCSITPWIANLLRDPKWVMKTEDKVVRNQQFEFQSSLPTPRQVYDSVGPERDKYQCKVEGCTRGTVKYSPFCRLHDYESKYGKSPFDH